MRLVRKYPLALEKWQEVSMPLGAHPVHCAAIADAAWLWAMVNPDADLVTCTVRMFETGEEFEEWSEDRPEGFRGDYIGTAIFADGREVHFVRQVK